MPKINVNGTHFFYEIEGTGHPLLLIAGFTQDSLFWTPILSELKKHFKVLVFDNRGVGRSDRPDIPYTIEMMAQDTLALVKSLDIGKPHVIGHSMGGSIAQLLAYRHADTFSRFALCNTLIKFNSVSTRFQNFLLHLKEMGVSQQLIAEGILPWLYSSDFLQNQENVDKTVNYFLNHPFPQSFIGYKRQLEALVSFDSTKWYHQIKAPVLIINGAEDILCPFDSERLAKGIPGSKLIHFPKMGHLPMVEQPHQFNHCIIQFFISREC